MNTSNDRHYFRDNPERNFHMRIASPDELADLRSRNKGALNSVPATWAVLLFML